ncbi:hypothetical protein ACIP6X_40310 [Streptomyces coeruleorubidus]|uniref:hypothetical protein n=1 Tax=Streptomyces coeruleorubidus TaxID=116188 RepID=UPI0038061FF6
MNTLFDVELTQDQRRLLSAIAAPWLDAGEWPLWANVQHQFDLRGEDADAIFQSLPRVGSEAPFASGYGFTVPLRAPIGPRDRPRLTVAASLVLPEVRMVAGEPFVDALRHMIDLYASRPLIVDDVPTIMLRSGELATAFPRLKPWFVKVLPDLLSYEPAISTGGAQLGDGSWEREVTRSVMQFSGVKTVEDYIAKTTEIVTATAAQFVTIHEGVNLEIAPLEYDFAPVEGEAPPAAAPERRQYVDAGLMDDLDGAAKKTPWRVRKLIALCQELNDAFVVGSPHACAALIRAILDHIPPVFGHKDFRHVAAQHSFPVQRTDKAHAKNLADFKDIADDVMHRPIGFNVPVISMDDIPAPVRLNAILHEVLRLLRKEAAANP